MFDELRHSKQLSPALRTGMTDGRILRHYLLLHDAQLKSSGGMPWSVSLDSTSALPMAPLEVQNLVIQPIFSKRGIHFRGLYFILRAP